MRDRLRLVCGVAALALAAVALPACPKGSGGGTTGRTSHALSHTWVVKPNKFAEANLHMGEGAQVHVEFSATDLMQWNVHSHVNGQMTIHQQGEGTAGTIDFTAPVTGSYSLLWQNDNSSSVKLEITVEGGAKLESWQP
jgi:hypothetical protein